VSGQSPRPDPPFAAPEPRTNWSIPARLSTVCLLLAGAYAGSRVLVRFGIPARNGFFGLAAVFAFGVQLVRERLRRSEAAPELGLPSAPLPINDLSVAMPAAWSSDRLVDFVLVSMQRHMESEEIVTGLMASGFSEQDAHVAIARTVGGIVRARTRNRRDEPSRLKDPIAWRSYRRALEHPELLGVLAALPRAPGPK
jgi:hypothetical protein